MLLRYDTSGLHVAIDKKPVMQVDEVHDRKDQQRRLPAYVLAGHAHQSGNTRTDQIIGKRPDIALLPGSCERFGLNETQRQKVHSYVVERGAAYLHEKVAVVVQEPRKNSAKALLAALRDDWKPAVEIKRGQRQKKETSHADVEQRINMSAEDAAKALRELRTSLA